MAVVSASAMAMPYDDVPPSPYSEPAAPAAPAPEYSAEPAPPTYEAPAPAPVVVSDPYPAASDPYADPFPVSY